MYVQYTLNKLIIVYLHVVYEALDALADRVLGQPDFHASASNDMPAGGTGSSRCGTPRPASACTLNSPMELSLTPGGELLVPDLDNNRVLLWSAVSLARLQSPACVPTC